MLFVLLAVVSKGYAQFPEGFEGASFPPVGWTSFIGSNGLGTVNDWSISTDPAYISTGNQSAYVQYEGGTGDVNEDWLVTPQFTVTAPNTLLAFFESQTYGLVDYGTIYTIRVSTTSQTNIASFTIVDTKTEADIPSSMAQRSVDLSAYVGQSIYVAFVMAQDDGDDWAIDDVSLEPFTTTPNCATLTSPADGATGIVVGPAVAFTWDAPTTGPTPVSYDVWGGTTLPLTSADLIGNFTTTSGSLPVPAYDTTYYWKVIPKNVGGSATGCTTFSFTTQSPPGYCLNGNLYPDTAYVPQVCDGATAESITDFGYAGEYSLVSLTSGLTYEFSSSNATDFITISSEDASTVYTFGTTPVTWTATSDQTVRFYTHLDNQCGTEQVERTRAVMCSGFTALPPDCATLTFPADGAIDVPVGSLVTFTWDAPTTGTTPDSYDIYGGTTLPLTAANLITNVTTTSIGITINPPAYNTTFYWMVVPRNLAGEATDCTSFSFTTIAAPGYCLNGNPIPYPTDTYVVSSCDGTTVEDIIPTADGYAGEYSNVSVTSGYTYQFSSSIATDFITISADDGVTAAIAGITPVTWTAAADGVVRFYTHADDQCATNSDPRQRSVLCSGGLSLPTFNTSSIKAYPNPVKDMLNLISDKMISKVQVTNLLGQVVLEKAVNTTNGQINVSNLASGTYLVKITSEDLVKTIKVIKE